MRFQARLEGIHIVVASVENNINDIELKGLSSLPHEHNLFNVQRFSQLPAMFTDIIAASCNSE